MPRRKNLILSLSKDAPAAMHQEAGAAFKELPLRRRNVANLVDELAQCRAIPFQMRACSRCWPRRERYAGTMLRARPDRAWHEATAAIGADILQHGLGAMSAECA